ncbi:S-adenosyl-L-methionine-dependent methyltransferase [Zopfia rhizophila CBS 207.26]|uniref:S-adenosyl-L-methionine-dependent methyltransferase n=1 Tax=Zopfia rhizophila CBS 207.26 TaxID=1314779 RepID=A0A6A6EP08_9PEZI|nr:S-adenosyl-L-methionine-dependent methyltransferase [Zopfia rhizophila CBS 207.26]
MAEERNGEIQGDPRDPTLDVPKFSSDGAFNTVSRKGKEPAQRDSVVEQIEDSHESEPHSASYDSVNIEPPTPHSQQDPPARVLTSIAIKTQSSPQATSPTEDRPAYSFQQQSICPLQQDPQAAQPPVPQDDGEEDETEPFSDYSDETESLTESINSLNYQYQDENGRRYHGFTDAAYLLPNDEREQERLEGQHQTWLMILGGKLHLAPLKPNIQNVLDVATGTGVWAMDFADLYPSAKVIGTDLSPIQPNLSSVPPNCSFIVEDSEGEWMWDERFDYIHSRTLASAWRDWPGYFRKCYEHLKPGGYLELHEFTFPFHCDDDTAPPENPMMVWSRLFNEGCAKAGVEIEQCANLDPWLREAGFVDVTKLHKRQPFNGWSDDPDERCRGIFYSKIFDWGVSMALLTRRLGWTREAAELFLVDVRKAAADTRVHTYIPLYIYTARKPESATG